MFVLPASSGPFPVILKQVLANIYINVQLHWRPGLKSVALKIASPYREEGIINELDDIEPF